MRSPSGFQKNQIRPILVPRQRNLRAHIGGHLGTMWTLRVQWTRGIAQRRELGPQPPHAEWELFHSVLGSTLSLPHITGTAMASNPSQCTLSDPGQSCLSRVANCLTHTKTNCIKWTLRQLPQFSTVECGDIVKSLLFAIYGSSNMQTGIISPNLSWVSRCMLGSSES